MDEKFYLTIERYVDGVKQSSDYAVLDRTEYNEVMRIIHREDEE